MNTPTAYTPLESLLLFQSLTASGTDSDVFVRTSNLLKSNALIRDSETYDPGRLSPDALRELYLRLLREELRIEASQGEVRGDTSPSKKRKLQSPPLPTIKDANEYGEKLPQLVDRLYGRYRDNIIKSIREDERRYEVLQREIAEIEQGGWDERILKEERGRPSRTPSVVAEDAGSVKAVSTSPLPIVATLEDNRPVDPGTEILQGKDAQPPNNDLQSLVPASHTESRPEGLAISDVLNSQESPLPSASEPQTSLHDQNNSQVLPLPDHQRTASHERLQGPAPIISTQQRPENWKWEQYQGVPPAQQPPYQQSPNYPQYPPQHYPPYPAGPHRGSFPILPLQGHVPSSPLNTHPHPIVLPPPNIGRGQLSPATRHLDQLADVAEQQFRALSGSPLLPQVGVPGTQFGQPYPQYAAPYRAIDGRPLSGNGTPPQWNQNYAPPYGQPPNYNYPHQPPVQPTFPARTDILQPGQRQYNSPYNASQGPRPIGTPATSTPRPLHLRDAGSLPHTPVSSGVLLHSTGKATRWTPNPTASTPKAPRSPVRPAFEPLSPVLPPAKPVKTPKGIGKGKRTETTAILPRGKGQRGTQKIRGSSPASSAMAGSFRSQSVMSHADELSLVNDGIAGHVKQESATPRAVDDIGDTTADESTNRPGRGTMRASPRRPTKRKRQESPLREPSGPPTHAMWTRNFPKISASALERIAAHRHASIFAQPIKERDAPGYKQLILRPQDLKSIRTAINVGYKSGMSTVSTMDDQGQASMMLPISEDLIPPKGIVNNAQLEKELMRMFANAIMFNHDPNRSLGKAFEVAQSIESGEDNYDVDEHGIVKQTRVMYGDVEKIVGEMRSAEWRKEEDVGEVEEDEVDQLAGAVESDAATGSIAKRRRRA